MKTTMTDAKHLEQQIALAKKIVARWPAWKQSILENSYKEKLHE